MDQMKKGHPESLDFSLRFDGEQIQVKPITGTTLRRNVNILTIESTFQLRGRTPVLTGVTGHLSIKHGEETQPRADFTGNTVEDVITMARDYAAQHMYRLTPTKKTA